MKIINQFTAAAGRSRYLLAYAIPAAIADLAIIIWMLTELLDATSFVKGTAIAVGVTFLLFEIAHKLLRAKRFKQYAWIVWGIFWFVSLLVFLCGEWIIARNRNLGEVELSLSLAGERGAPLLLTNDFLKYPVGKNNFKMESDSVKGFVIVPILGGATNAGIIFGLKEAANFDLAMSETALKLYLPSDLRANFDSNLWVDQFEENTSDVRVLGYEIHLISPIRSFARAC